MSMPKALMVAVVALLTALVALAAAGQADRSKTSAPAGFFFETVQAGGRSMHGVVYRPRGLDPAATMPTLVFLHGRGECGRDGSRHLTVGLPAAIMARPERWPFVVVMPQKPEASVEWEDYEDGVFALLEVATERYGADPDRVAITGLSQGGHGTIAIASRHPDRFAAATPVCGYVERWNEAGVRNRVATTPDSPALTGAADALAALPVWVFHGGRDDVVSPSESRLLHAAIEARGGAPKLTVFPDDNHNSWDSAYRESGLWGWLEARLAE